MVAWIIIGASIIWYPHSLMRAQSLGYDFTIFYVGPNHPGWVYAPWLSVFFEPLRMFDHDTAFLLNYSLNALAYWYLVRKVLRRHRDGGILVFLLSLYPYLLSQELGAVTPILASLCLTFPGAVFATLWKPYLAGFAFVHAVHRVRRIGKAQAQSVDSVRLQDESVVSDGLHDNQQQTQVSD